MLVSFFLRRCPAMAETVRCSVSDCEESAAGSLEGCSFCREHFISTCYEQLDQCRNWQEARRSEEHTSELQSPCNLVCRLLLEKKKIIASYVFILFSQLSCIHSSLL